MMKRIHVTCLLIAACFASASFADELLCASKASQTLYVSTGQLKLKAEISSPTLLNLVSLTTTGDGDLGFQEDELIGAAHGNDIRFFASDAWCDYRLSLPKNFMTALRTPLFLDAVCEDDIRSRVRLYCTVN